MINIMKEVCVKTLESDQHSTDQSIAAYRQLISDVYMPILDELTLIVNRNDISPEDRRYFADKMIDIANKADAVTDKIGAKDTEAKQFKIKSLCRISNSVYCKSVYHSLNPCPFP